ncbi:MAG: tRNA glutamyl-Q(34) synthetase GluQRS [Prevotella sp.]|nr:tRNA glutamyl-Q(34) synthetase GluQRS [Prevotella sp.]
MKGRFAPSPTGRMHLGNVFSALLSWLSIKSQGGEWLLRIEDIDPQRSKQHYADQIMCDLEWLGLTWDEGPYYQSERSDIYEEHLSILRNKGLLYPSYKTRAERLAVSAPQSSLPSSSLMGGEKPLKGGGAAATSLRVSDTIVTYTDRHYGKQTIDMKNDIGDFIVRRRDGAWAYQLAVVVDDALMGITEVVRGRDLLRSAGQQIYLGELFGFPRMEYAHLPLLCNEAGQRLSKRDKSMDLGQLQQRFSAEEIIGTLAFFAHLIDKNEPCRPQDLLPLFDWNKVPLADIKVEIEKS